MGLLLSGEEVFGLAKQIEKGGHAYYTTVAEATDSEELKKLFEFLAQQEIAHYRLFEDLSASVPEVDVDDDEWEQTSDYIRATTESRFFVGDDKAISLAKTVGDPLEAIDIAISFEKDTLLFFNELLNVTPDAITAAVEKIVEQEKQHVKLLMERKRAFAQHL